MSPLAIGSIEVSPLAMGFIGLAVVFVLMFVRVPIAFAFGAVGFIGIWLIRGAEPAFEAIRTIPYATVSKYIYTVVPLFVLMGYLALQTKLANSNAPISGIPLMELPSKSLFKSLARLLK